MTLVISKGLTLDNGTRAAAIAGVSPTLDYRFAREKREIETVSLTDKLTYTGGNGTFVGSDGFIQPATTNVPRFDHDPLSRRSLGLLSEVERTNGIRNSTGVGAVAGTPGTVPTNWGIVGLPSGVTSQIVGVVVIGGVTCVRIRLSGTPAATLSGRIDFEGLTTVAAANGQTWTFSSWLRLHAGSQSNLGINVRVLGRDASFTGYNLVSTAVTFGVALSRSFVTSIFSNAAIIYATADLQLSFVSGQAVDCTFDVGFPQLELGATASTPIPTSTTAVTRTADSAVIDGTGVLTGTYTLVEKPAGCAVVSGTNINLQPGFTAERVMVFPAALDAGQITAIRGAM
jgi:hypothetical protein